MLKGLIFMKVTTTITNKELEYIHEYAKFYRKPFPCTQCSPREKAACCGCLKKDQYDKDKQVFDEKFANIDKSITQNQLVKEYVEALKSVADAFDELDAATLKFNSRKHSCNAILEQFTIVEEEDHA